jgi:16S rRNA processing protein RimM
LNNSTARKGLVCIGRFVGAHGVKGSCKIRPFVESLSAFQPGSSIFVGASENLKKAYEINWVKSHAKIVLLSLKGVANRHQAEALIGAELFIEKARLPELNDGSYYWFDLIGLDVFAMDETYVGRLESIIATGSNDVYVVKHQGDEIWIPALRSVVKGIDLERKRMQVDLPEGLSESNSLLDS